MAVRSATEALAARLRAGLTAAAGMWTDEPLARRTTMRVGGVADVLVEPGGEADLAYAVGEADRLGVPWRVIGRGSNLLVRDGGVRGLVLNLCRPAFAEIRVEERRLVAGAGVRLKDLAGAAQRAGLAGLEFLGGIPGSVGGALRMNAGAWESDTFRCVESIRVLHREGRFEDRPASEVPAAYRRCDLFRECIAVGAVFRGEPSSPEAVAGRMRELNERRWASQPPQSSAGCIFKNPAGIPAGRLIDELGLKGTRIGGASVSTVHGNFIINEGGATAADVLALIDRIRCRAREERGIELQTEVEILGE
ncbi:MAG: UDP-N-acetylmuramate dehydrogenase [Verrucomicrobiae bacterium]|nr:UDP-N-acetylmuramate dehydrogenase [Verrucomicrobiae bacterium]